MTYFPLFITFAFPHSPILFSNTAESWNKTVFANNTSDHGDTDKFESRCFNSPVCYYFLQPLKHFIEKEKIKKHSSAR